MKHKVLARAALAVAAVSAVALAAATAEADAARLPERGVFVPGRSLAGARLGMTKADVLRVWGKRHGVCRGCRRTTWYFNYRPFEPEGAGVVFRRGRVVRLFTVWQPAGWRTPGGLVLGDGAGRVTELYGNLARRRCSGYIALVSSRRRAQSVFYVYRGKLWGFGLARPRMSPCV